MPVLRNMISSLEARVIASVSLIFLLMQNGIGGGGTEQGMKYWLEKISEYSFAIHIILLHNMFLFLSTKGILQSTKHDRISNMQPEY